MPIWALPPSLLIIFVKGIWDVPLQMTPSVRRYLEFKSAPDDDEIATLLSRTTYIGLDYKIAVWAYIYLAVYFLFAILAFVSLIIAVLAIFMGLSLTEVWVIVLITMFLIGPTAMALFGEGGDSLFLRPYLEMVSNTIPKDHDKEIEKDLQPVSSKVFRKYLSLKLKKQLKSQLVLGRTVDDLFVAQLAIVWHRTRETLVEHERRARKHGRQHFARFLITRKRLAQAICLYLYTLEMYSYEWSTRAGDMVEDLKRMARGKVIDVPFQPRPILTRENFRQVIGPSCPPDCMEVFLALWNRTELPHLDRELELVCPPRFPYLLVFPVALAPAVLTFLTIGVGSGR